jgi:hypothetical protein
MRETSADDFRYEDLERLPTEELARITEWLTEKVDALSTRLKAEPKEDEVGTRGGGCEGGLVRFWGMCAHTEKGAAGFNLIGV